MPVCSTQQRGRLKCAARFAAGASHPTTETYLKGVVTSRMTLIGLHRTNSRLHLDLLLFTQESSRGFKLKPGTFASKNSGNELRRVFRAVKQIK